MSNSKNIDIAKNVIDIESKAVAAIADKIGKSFEDAVRAALQEVVGAYGIVVVCQDEPDKIIAARNGSPLVLGLGEDENFVGSDISAIMEHTRNVLYLDDGEIVEITKDGYSIKHIEHDNEIIKDVKEIEFTLEQIEKGDYKHFMLKEIFEQPSSIEQGFKGRVDSNNIVRLGGVYDLSLIHISEPTRPY